jgi:hypothetical protein
MWTVIRSRYERAPRDAETSEHVLTRMDLFLLVTLAVVFMSYAIQDKERECSRRHRLIQNDRKNDTSVHEVLSKT